MLSYMKKFSIENALPVNYCNFWGLFHQKVYLMIFIHIHCSVAPHVYKHSYNE